MPARVLLAEMAVILTQPCLELGTLSAAPLLVTPPVNSDISHHDKDAPYAGISVFSVSLSLRLFLAMASDTPAKTASPPQVAIITEPTFIVS